MWTCVFVFAHFCLFICICVCVLVCLYLRICACLFICVFVYLCTRNHPSSTLLLVPLVARWAQTAPIIFKKRRTNNCCLSLIYFFLSFFLSFFLFFSFFLSYLLSLSLRKCLLSHLWNISDFILTLARLGQIYGQTNGQKNRETANRSDPMMYQRSYQQF